MRRPFPERARCKIAKAEPARANRSQNGKSGETLNESAINAVTILLIGRDPEFWSSKNRSNRGINRCGNVGCTRSGY